MTDADDLFEPDQTQRLLQASLLRWLGQQAAFERRAAWFATPAAIVPFWQGLAQDLGLLGAGFGEALGGHGGGLAEHGLIMQALGAALMPEPYLTSAVLCGGLLQRAGGAQAGALIGGLVDGRLRLALAAGEPQSRHDLADVRCTLRGDGHAGGWLLSGRKAMVRGAPAASHWLVSARDDAGRLRLVAVDVGAVAGAGAGADVTRPGSGLQWRALRTVDGGWAAELQFDELALPAEALLGAATGGAGPAGVVDALPWLEQAVDDATLALCAEAVGLMRRVLRDTLDYARQRKQFGVAIASFQVLQHRLADMHIALQLAAALTGDALLQPGGAPQVLAGEAARQRACAVSSAKVAVARACRQVGQGAVQIHGGMGMSDELFIGHGFKRLTLIESQFGDVDHHLGRIERLSAMTA